MGTQRPEILLPNVGWNFLPYPVQANRPVSQALASIAGKYTVVYHYDTTSGAAVPWTVFGPSAPQWASDLVTLTFGNAYLIYTTEPVTVSLKGTGVSAATADSLPIPPAVIYHLLSAEEQAAYSPGTAVTARIGDRVCGTSQVASYGDDNGFVIKVRADDFGDWAGCGAVNRDISIQIGDRLYKPKIAWNNTAVSRLEPVVGASQ